MKKFIVYSGLDTRAMTSAPTSDTDLFQINLTGSVYSTIHLETVLQTVRAWTLQPLNDKTVKAHLRWTGEGSSPGKPGANLRSLARCRELRPYLNQEDYYSLLKCCQVNMYIRGKRHFIIRKYLNLWQRGGL